MPPEAGGVKITRVSRWTVNIILWLIAAFYAYGALVHVLNILDMTGFEWSRAPLKWQVLDIVYLVLDIIVVVGLPGRLWVGYGALIVAAGSQILLYTVFRDWIIDVPEQFARSPEEIAYLDWLVGFHIVTLVLVCLVGWLNRRDFSG